MSYIGSSAAPLPVAFSGVRTQSFSGTGSQPAFTLSRAVSAVTDIEVVVNNVQQSPFDSSYSVSGATLTFSEAPSSGTNNIYVIFRDQPVGSLSDPTAVKLTGDQTITGAKTFNGAVTVGRVNSASEGGQIDLCRSTDNASAWAVDVYGDTSTPSLRFVDNTASATRMQIDGAGRVTKPYQPFFSAHRNSAVSYSDGQTIIWNAIVGSGNVGEHYSTSTGRFTAPVAGVYIFRVDFRQSGNGVGYCDIRSSTGLVTRHEEPSSSPNGYHQTISCLYKLAGGDYVWVQAGGATSQSPDSNTVNRFEGYLLG
jgi:hypothetical protein